MKIFENNRISQLYIYVKIVGFILLFIFSTGAFLGVLFLNDENRRLSKSLHRSNEQLETSNLALEELSFIFEKSGVDIERKKLFEIINSFIIEKEKKMKEKGIAFIEEIPRFYDPMDSVIYGYSEFIVFHFDEADILKKVEIK
jgi:hypothetical protein